VRARGRRRSKPSPGRSSGLAAYYLTSLTADQAGPAELDRLVRGHWGIENRVHYVRDVTYDEDRSQAFTGNGPRTLATCRNLAISVLRNRPVADIVAAYRSQADIEAGFRQLKDPHVIAVNPMFHWTDQKIRVHALYSVAALAVAHLMRRQAHHANLDLSVRELLRHLNAINEITMLYPGDRGRPRARRALTELDPTQRRLYKLFDLDTYAPTR